MLASLCLSCVNGAAEQWKYRGFTIAGGRDMTITGCGQIIMRVVDLQRVRSEQERTLPKSAVSPSQAL
jgi:hypothetical protein